MQSDLTRELELKLRELDAINAIGRALTSSLDLGEVLSAVMQRIAELLQPRQWSLLLSDEETAALVFRVTCGEQAERLVGARLSPDEGLAGWATRERCSVRVDDAAADPRFSTRVAELAGFVPRALIAVPLVFRGDAFGVVLVANGENDRIFTAEDERLVVLMAEFAAIAIANARSFRRVEELTVVDEHTGLFNARYLRRVLDSEVERARRFSRPLSVIFLDLDHFKRVNDSFGHAVGTAVLVEVGEVIRRGLRTVDVPTRYAGDEFVVVLPETSKNAAVEVAERLHAALGQQSFRGGGAALVRLSGSFGVASYPEDGDTAEKLLEAADGAMYEVKTARRDGVAAAGNRVA